MLLIIPFIHKAYNKNLNMLVCYRPRLLTENGHLYIMSGSNHNITLRTSGHGYININNENLLQITHMVL